MEKFYEIIGLLNFFYNSSFVVVCYHDHSRIEEMTAVILIIVFLGIVVFLGNRDKK